MPQCCLSHRTQLWLIFLTLLLFSTVQADILVFSNADRHQIEEEFRDMPARFGGQIPPEGIKVILSPLNAFIYLFLSFFGENIFMLNAILYLYLFTIFFCLRFFSLFIDIRLFISLM